VGASIVTDMRRVPTINDDPFAWQPAVDAMLAGDYATGSKLAEAGWAVEEFTWGDEDVGRPYQRITTFWPTKGKDGKPAVWVRIEVAPWVKSADAIQTRQSTYPVIYGRLADRHIPPDLDRLLDQHYPATKLDAAGVEEWAKRAADNWYDAYYTVAVDPAKPDTWPEELREKKVIAELKRYTLGPHDQVILARPTDKVYVIIIRVKP
jgi:hypothetical protein